jgi:hypothetical protein
MSVEKERMERKKISRKDAKAGKVTDDRFADLGEPGF